MSDSGPKSLPAIGFLTVREFVDAGFCGGFLVLNAVGRPLEFHCTAPVKANRAQEILYGPTLQPFLYGEQIGQTLVSRAKVQPLLVVTDNEPALALRPFCTMPVICLLDEKEIAPPPNNKTYRVDAAHALSIPRRLGGQALRLHSAHARDGDEVCALWQKHFEGFNLREPFERIGEALEESRKT
jgi:hypothetical protein